MAVYFCRAVQGGIGGKGLIIYQSKIAGNCCQQLLCFSVLMDVGTCTVTNVIMLLLL